MKFGTSYSRKRVCIDQSNELSKTEQCYKDECSIDFIISNFVRTGIDPNKDKKMSFIDCTTVQDFQTAQNLLAETKSMFECLPAHERDKFHNRVEEYLDFISNPKNLKDSYERGLIDKSSVDILDVYPERKEVSNVVETVKNIDESGVKETPSTNS